MQERNDYDETIATQMLDMSKAEEASKRIQEALARPEVKSVAIGNLPDKGDLFTLNGLHYVVKFVDYKRGEVRIKLYTPEKTF